MFKRLLLSSAVLPLTLFHIAPAAAQEAAPPESADEGASHQGFTDIIVTARRVEENLQRVPTSVTAVSGDMLRTESVIAVKDLPKLAPSLSVVS